MLAKVCVLIIHDTLISIFYHFLEMHSSGARNVKFARICDIWNRTIDSPLENLLSIFILNIKTFYFSLILLPSKYKERAKRKGKERKSKSIEFNSLSLSSNFDGKYDQNNRI